MRIYHYLPCSNPCDSCFSPAPETLVALPQPETQTCTCRQVQKVNTQCTSLCHSSAYLYPLHVYIHPLWLKTASLSWILKCSWHAHFTQLRRFSLVVFSSHCLFIGPYQISRNCTLKWVPMWNSHSKELHIFTDHTEIRVLWLINIAWFENTIFF